MTRTPTHRYADPVDLIWHECARRVGFRIERSGEVYASTDGRRTIFIGAADLDADDCLAQMIFHELCHAMVQGDEGVDRPDWGLENSDDRDVPREHACLRLQAFLAGGYGLRRALAPTTDFRAFYDALPADPFAPRRHPEVVLAVTAARRADQPPWGPHVREALAATAAIATQARTYAPRDTLWATADESPAAHPLGGRTRNGTCAGCAWAFHGGTGRAVDRCRQHGDARIEPGGPACDRFEPVFDCQDCGACCRAAYHSVTISRRDPAVTRHPELIEDRGEYLEIRRAGDRCAALQDGRWNNGTFVPYACSIYDERPRPCREFERGGVHCLTARRRVGLSL
ncbi:MAG TPA: YkgJ family cysteine cluster protein [Kofleriaceae bacterium]|nr:YkgJ family cysteine cluster protein [Kofleriaceae bacterium]